MKTAVIDVGGGLRGMYAAGVLDYCLEKNIQFDLGIGVSAGSANIASYAAHQKGRNYTFYKEYSRREEYMSPKNWKEKGSFVDLDYVYSTLSNSDGENPLDYKAIMKNPMEIYTVATNAITGHPAYFGKDKMAENEYSIFKASCSIPVVCPPYKVKNVPFFDGALSDPIPLDKAFELGAERVVLILTKPAAIPRTPYKDSTLSLLMHHYPKAAHGLRHRAETYNAVVDRARELEKEGRVIIISPDDTCGVDTLKRDDLALHNLYLKGYLDGEKIEQFLSSQPAEPDAFQTPDSDTEIQKRPEMAE